MERTSFERCLQPVITSHGDTSAQLPIMQSGHRKQQLHAPLINATGRIPASARCPSMNTLSEKKAKSSQAKTYIFNLQSRTWVPTGANPLMIREAGWIPAELLSNPSSDDDSDSETSTDDTGTEVLPKKDARWRISPQRRRLTSPWPVPSCLAGRSTSGGIK